MFYFLGFLKKLLIFFFFCQVWPYEESDECGFVQGLFGMMRAIFSRESENPSFLQSIRCLEVCSLHFQSIAKSGISLYLTTVHSFSIYSLCSLIFFFSLVL